MDKKGVVQMELLKAWRDWIGADHVLRVQNSYLMCETVPEIDFEEIVYTPVRPSGCHSQRASEPAS